MASVAAVRIFKVPEHIRASNRLSYRKNKEKYAARARLLRATNGDQLRTIQNKAQKKCRTQRRRDAIAHYGGQCACCGESTLEFLGIDHINNDGAAHRKVSGISGSGIYLWLRRNNYPAGFQVLCHNCNLAKGFYGSCPHSLSVKA